MDLHEAETWWTFWQTNGHRDSDGPGVNHEREAATTLQAEYDQLRAQRAAALAIHHREDGYVCGGSCAYCRDSDEDPVKWPCPTARALGVTS